MTKIIKGFTITPELFAATKRLAAADGRSFSAFVSRALAREIQERHLKPNPAAAPDVTPAQGDIIYTKDVASLLDVSVKTVLRRSARVGHPLFAARVPLASKKPMAFSLAKIRALQRAA